MKGTTRIVLAAVALIFAAGQARASEGDDDERAPVGHRLGIALGATYSSFTAQRSRTTFGDSGWQPAVRIVSRLGTKGVHLSLAPVYAHYGSGDHQGRLLGGTVGIGVTLAPAGGPVVPFASLRAGPYVVSTSGDPSRTRPGGIAELGVQFLHRVIVSGGYERVGRANGFDLSTWSASALLRVY